MANTVDITLQLKKQGDALDKIEKDLKDLNKGLNKTEKEAKETDKALDGIGKDGSKGIDNLGTSFSGLGVAIAGATVAMGAFLTSVAANNKELQQLANLSGLSLEEFQKFSIAAELAGANADQTADALNDLSLKINEAVVLGGGAAVDVFRKLGLSLEEVQKLSPDKQFEALAGALQKVDAQQQKLFLDELASDALIQLRPLIEGYDEFTSKANDFANSGGIITQEDIDKTKDLTQSFLLLGKQVQTSGTLALGVFSDELTPIIQELIGYIQELSTETEDGFSTISIEAARLSSIISIVINSIRLLINGVQVFGEIAKQVFSNVAEAFSKILEGDFQNFKFKLNMEGIDKQIKDVEDSFKKLGPAIAGSVSPELLLVKNELDDIKEAVSDIPKGIFTEDQLNSNLQQLEDLQKKVDKIFSVEREIDGEIKIEVDRDNSIFKTITSQINQAKQEIERELSGIELVAQEGDVEIPVTPVVSVDDLEKQYEAAVRGINIAKLELELGIIGQEEFQQTLSTLTGQAQFALNQLINTGFDQKTIDDFTVKLLNVVKQYETLSNTSKKSKQDLDAFNAALLKGELEILKAQGLEEEVLKKQNEEKIKQIQNNDKLTAQQQQQLIAQQTQLTDIANAITQIADLQNSIAGLNTNDEEGFINQEDFDRLQEYIDKIKELEQAYGLAGTASQEASLVQQEAINESNDAQDKAIQQMSSSFADMTLNAISGAESIEDAFLQMINQILAEMIKAQLTEMFTGLFSSGGALGGFGASFASFFHTGGVVGQDGFKKGIIPRYHTGGIAGLNPDEVPAVLQKGEEVLTANDPRHRNNGGAASNQQQIQINNLLDANQIADSLDGNQSFGNAIMNYITANKNEVNNTLSN